MTSSDKSTKKSATLELKNCINAWESSIFHDKFLMSPSTQVIVESTIKHLKEYQKLVIARMPKQLELTEDSSEEAG